MNEKSVNLAVARELSRRLETRGARVINSRTTDRFVSLDARADLAERTQADLFVSIHADAARRPSATGATVYIARQPCQQSIRAAQCIAQALARAGFKCRGIERANFRVLVGHSRPAVLVECGFLTNPGEAWKLSTPGYQTKLSAAIADGISTYFAR